MIIECSNAVIGQVGGGGRSTLAVGPKHAQPQVYVALLNDAFDFIPFSSCILGRSIGLA